jgi:hypothetical protein
MAEVIFELYLTEREEGGALRYHLRHRLVPVLSCATVLLYAPNFVEGLFSGVRLKK